MATPLDYVQTAANLLALSPRSYDAHYHVMAFRGTLSVGLGRHPSRMGTHLITIRVPDTTQGPSVRNRQRLQEAFATAIKLRLLPGE